MQKLIDACFQQDDKLYLCVSSPTIKDKPVSYHVFFGMLISPYSHLFETMIDAFIYFERFSSSVIGSYILYRVF